MCGRFVMVLNEVSGGFILNAYSFHLLCHFVMLSASIPPLFPFA